MLSNTKHWLIEQASLYPNKTAIQTEHDIISYQQFFENCTLLVNYLQNNNVKKNDHVGILFTHSYKFFVTINALWFIGAIPIPLNTRKTINEIEDEIHIADVKFLIIDELLKSQFSFLNFQNLLDVNVIKMHETQDYNLLIRNSKFEILNSSLIMFTSGSTGKPKAVVHTFQSLYESVLALDSFAELTPNDIWLASLPCYHIGGFMILVRSLIGGSSVVFPALPKFEDIEQTIKQSNPSHISLVPTVLQNFLKSNTRPNRNLKYVFLGGGPSQKELIIEAANKSWPVVKVYGSTETCSMITALHPNSLESKPNSVGKAIGRNKIKIMGKNNVGEIAVSSKSLFKEYYNDQQTTNNKSQNDWYYTGDYGLLDDEGYLYIESRRDDLIISGGENINTLEVELNIRKHPLVKEAFVFGLQDNTWGQIVCAAIISAANSEDEIKDFLKDKLAAYKIPKRIYIVDKIPRNEIDKVNRIELLKLLKLS